MKTEIEWAELHAPLFLSGTNLQMKLDPKLRIGLKLEYDEEKRHLYVSYNGKSARVPETSVLSMVEKGGPKQIDERMLTASEVMARQPFNPSMAQVSTPTSHVFAGAGHGSTGQEEPKAKAKGKGK